MKILNKREYNGIKKKKIEKSKVPITEQIAAVTGSNIYLNINVDTLA